VYLVKMTEICMQKTAVQLRWQHTVSAEEVVDWATAGVERDISSNQKRACTVLHAFTELEMSHLELPRLCPHLVLPAAQLVPLALPAAASSRQSPCDACDQSLFLLALCEKWSDDAEVSGM
jgi:hypothetical protein